MPLQKTNNLTGGNMLALVAAIDAAIKEMLPYFSETTQHRQGAGRRAQRNRVKK